MYAIAAYRTKVSASCHKVTFLAHAIWDRKGRVNVHIVTHWILNYYKLLYIILANCVGETIWSVYWIDQEFLKDLYCTLATL